MEPTNSNEKGAIKYKNIILVVRNASVEYGKSPSWYARAKLMVRIGKTAAITPMTTPGPGAYGPTGQANKLVPKWR